MQKYLAEVKIPSGRTTTSLNLSIKCESIHNQQINIAFVTSQKLAEKVGKEQLRGKEILQGEL